MAVYYLRINGVVRPALRGTLRLTRRVNIRPTLEVEVLSLDGTGRPAEGDTVELLEGGITIYGGRIQHPSTEGMDRLPITPTGTRIACVDRQALADELYLTTTFPGGTVKAFLQWVIAGYLGAKGTTLDPAQVDGPVLPAVAFTYRSLKRVSDGITDACQIAIGWSWTIDPSNVLEAHPPTAVNAPFNINPSNRQAIGDVRVEVTSELYANRIIVLGSEQVIIQYKDEFTSLTDGVRTVFPLALRATGDSAPKPNAGVVWVIADDGSPVAETFGSPSDIWEFDATTNTVIDHGPPAGYRTYPLPLGRAAWIIYDGIPTAIGMAEDVAAQAIRGVVERVLTSTVQDTPTLDAIAAAELVKALARPITVTYETDGLGLAPGQLQAIDVPARGISGTFVLQAVETRDIFAMNTDATPRLRHTVTAVEYVVGATVYPGTVGDLYTLWAGDGSATGAAPTVSAPGLVIPGDPRDVLFNDGGVMGAAADLLYDKNATGAVYGAEAAPATLAVLLDTEGVTPTADVLLLVGAESAVLDESTYARVLTPVGTAARTTTQAKFGTASLTFDGTGDWVQAADSAELTLGAGDFTIEGWFRLLVKTDNQTLLGQWDNAGLVANSSWLFYVTSGSLTVALAYGTLVGDVTYVTHAWTPTLGQWYHLAVDRQGSTVRLYIDGAAVTTATTSVTLNNSTHPLTLGAIGTTGHFAGTDFQGQMDEVRITKGHAWYAGAFTPPTTAFARPRRLLAAFANRAAGIGQAVTLRQTDAGASTLGAPDLSVVVPGGLHVTGAMLDVNAAGVVTALSGDVTATGAGTGAASAATIAAHAITDGKLRAAAALSVVGRAVNSTGDVADIVAAADHRVLKRAASALAWSAVDEDDLALTDVLTANVATTRHGFAPKLPNDATKYLDGTGAYTVPAGGGGATHYDCPLSDGDLTAADLIYAAGECVIVQVPV
jgi:hypothetical protein